VFKRIIVNISAYTQTSHSAHSANPHCEIVMQDRCLNTVYNLFCKCML